MTPDLIAAIARVHALASAFFEEANDPFVAHPAADLLATTRGDERMRAALSAVWVWLHEQEDATDAS